MTIEIKTGVPIPQNRGGRPLTYPFDRLDIGQSFEIAYAAGEAAKVRGRINSAAHAFSKRNPNKRFSVRLMDNHKIGVWRVK